MSLTAALQALLESSRGGRWFEAERICLGQVCTPAVLAGAIAVPTQHLGCWGVEPLNVEPYCMVLRMVLL